MADEAPTPLPLYFAYGSNLDPGLIGQRCPGHRFLCRALLPDHALRFQGHSRTWGGATATVEHVPGAIVHGVVYELTAADFLALDRAEGCLGPGHPDNRYDRVQLPVQLENGEWIEVFTYLMRPFPPGQPTRAYRWAILVGMRRWSLPAAALAAVEAVPTID